MRAATRELHVLNVDAGTSLLDAYTSCAYLGDPVDPTDNTGESANRALGSRFPMTHNLMVGM